MNSRLRHAMQILIHHYRPFCIATFSIVISNINLFAQALPFTEHFEDDEFESRGWYDSPQGTLTTDEHIEGSTSCLECKFLVGATNCEGGTPGRHLFDETEEIYLSYYVKYSANYTGSNHPYHPHEFYFLTNENDIYVGPAYTHLTTYVEHNEGTPMVGIQDGDNISESDIGVDLTGITELRAVAGCNGDSDGYGDGECYSCGAVHCNGKKWFADMIYFQDDPGQYYKNDWHFIEAYFKLNSIAGGIGQADGILQYWYDGELLIDHHDVVMRTGQYPDMQFNQFLIAPYIGDGSPVEQYMWIDDLTIAAARPTISNETVAMNSFFVNVFPNPFSTVTTVTLSAPDHTDKTLLIYNAMGEEVRSIKIPGGAGSIQVGREGMAPSIYFFRVMDSHQTLAAGSFVVK